MKSGLHHMKCDGLCLSPQLTVPTLQKSIFTFPKRIVIDSRWLGEMKSWILTVSRGSKCPGGKHEIISESHCSLKMKSISMLDISYFRKINQSWNKISLMPSSLFTKFSFLNTPLHSKRQHLFLPFQGLTAQCSWLRITLPRNSHFLLPLLPRTFPQKQRPLSSIHSCNTHF